MSVRTYRRLGELLIDRGAVKYLDLSIALADQKISKKRLGAILIERGFASEEDITACLAHQSGYPQVDLNTVQASPKVLSLIPADQALSLSVLPIEMTEDGLTVAVSNPTDNAVLDQIATVVNCNLIIQVAGPVSLQKVIRQAYGLAEPEATITESFERLPVPPSRYRDAKCRFCYDRIRVFDATDTLLGRPVSLICTPANDASAKDMHRAVQSASLGSIEGVAPIYDYVAQADYGWTVVPVIQGDSLDSVLRAMGQRSILQAAEIVAKVAEAMDSIEQLGGHGRWVCPRNLFLTASGVVAIPIAPLPASYQSPSPEYDAEHPGTGTAYVVGCLLRDCLFGTSGRQSRALPKAMRTILDMAIEPQPRGRYCGAIEVASALRSFN